MLWYVMLCYAMLCCAMICYVMLCHDTLCNEMLCCILLCYVMSCHVMSYYVMIFLLWYIMLCCGIRSEAIRANQTQSAISKNKKSERKQNTCLLFFCEAEFSPFFAHMLHCLEFSDSPPGSCKRFVSMPHPEKEAKSIRKTYESWKTTCCWAGEKQSTGSEAFERKKRGVPNSKPFFTIYTFFECILLYFAPLSGRCMEKNVYRCQGSCR